MKNLTTLQVHALEQVYLRENGFTNELNRVQRRILKTMRLKGYLKPCEIGFHEITDLGIKALKKSKSGIFATIQRKNQDLSNVIFVDFQRKTWRRGA